jgi:hypothetical protein
MKNRLLEIIGSLSHVLNAATGGSRFFSFSGRAHYCSKILKKRRWTYIVVLINGILFFHPNHCEREYVHESCKGKTPV